MAGCLDRRGRGAGGEVTAGLQLPASFYGLYRDVKREMSKVVTRLRRGEDWVAAIEARGFLDVATTPGHIVLEGPSSLVGGEDHFHTFVFLRLMFDRLNTVPGVLEQVFERSLTTVWGTLSLIGYDACTLIPRENHIPFLRAVVTCWDELEAVGRRYSLGLPYPKDLWSLPTTLGYVLANQGVPTPVLNAPLPPDGLLALIQRHGIDLTAGGDPGGAP